MSRISKAMFSLGLLIVSALPSNGGYPITGEEYGCLWWAHGSPYYHDYRALPGDNIPADYPGKKQVLCLHTAKYGMAIDTIRLDKIKVGEFKASVPYEAEIAEVDRAVLQLRAESDKGRLR